LLGEAEASPSGRFLIETERDLPVGDYIIRADALEPDGVKVAARAAVPFEREEGENLAAVAPSATPSVTAEPGSAAGAPTTAEPPAGDAQAPTEAPASGETAKPGDAPAAPGATTPSAPPAAADVSPPAAPSGTADASKPAAPEPAGAPVTPQGEKPSRSAAAPAEGGTAPATAAAPTAPAESATKPGTGAEIAATPEATPLAPKLESATGAVIIRRGDSLWRISRRVYGLGVRYSTIYLANQEQISDPDRIWPGQVFKVPEKTSEGEEADMKAVGEQATTTTTQ
jgi:nucleoid-associated protein YgaU